uniref:Histone chaperone domain-containing protein n=1 Tax=Sparus aurata TaxID=8175 RepID=A0A671WGL9_SPAAU
MRKGTSLKKEGMRVTLMPVQKRREKRKQVLKRMDRQEAAIQRKERKKHIDNNKTVLRLKRYISLCGVRRNYKKLLGGCKSIRSQVAVLKKELEDLGVHGNASIEKCKKARMKREETQELAALDVSNIIATQGRPRRSGALARQQQQNPPSSAYKRTLNSGSESEQENKPQTKRRRISDWANLQGIISDDADSD